MQGHLDITAGLRMSYHPVCFSLLEGLLIKLFSPNPPMPLWLHGKYVASTVYPVLSLFSQLDSTLVVDVHRVIVDSGLSIRAGRRPKTPASQPSLAGYFRLILPVLLMKNFAAIKIP